MFDVRITVMKIALHTDLMERFENPIKDACFMSVGDVFISHDATMPEGFCESAWQTVKEFVEELANGGGNFFGGWMKNPKSAMLSCNDGFRPVSFLIETINNNPIKE